MTPIRWAVLLAVAVSLGLALLRPSDSGGVMAGLEGRLLDARFVLRGSQPAPETVAILGIDDAALAAAGAFPLPRDMIAEAVAAAQAGGARAVALDLLLAGKGQGDADLAAVLGGTIASVLAISFLDETGAEASAALEASLSRSALPLVIGAPQGDVLSGQVLSGLSPEGAFLERAALGHVNVALEPDGALRRMPLLVQARPGLVLPALPVQAARLATGAELSAEWGAALRLGPSRVPLDANNEAVINFLGPAGTVQTTSLHRAAEADLDGRIVFIGATAGGYGDRFATPFAHEMPGVEALAHLAANVIEGRTLRRDDLTWGIDVMLAVWVALLGVWVAAFSLPGAAALAVLALWGAALGGLQLAFVNLLWLDGVTLLMALTVSTLSGWAARLVMQRRSTANLARYHSPLLQTVLAREAQPKFDGRVQQATVLFVDVANYTGRTEAVGPTAITKFLRQFHGLVETAATRHSGLVEQYAGDGALISFGLPEPTPEDPKNALDCAEALFKSVAVLSDQAIAEGQPPVKIRVGLHMGEATAAIVGGQDQGHVTFVGDVVNTASRLETAAKTLGAELVVSADLVAAVGDVSGHGLAPAGEVSLRGRTAPIEVWIRPNSAP